MAIRSTLPTLQMGVGSIPMAARKRIRAAIPRVADAHALDAVLDLELPAVGGIARIEPLNAGVLTGDDEVFGNFAVAVDVAWKIVHCIQAQSAQKFQESDALNLRQF